MQLEDLNNGFRLDDILVEPQEGTLRHPDGEICRLEPKVMQVLVALAAEDDRTVSRCELLESVWRGQAAADELLTRAISEIRRGLRDEPKNPKYIRTIPKRGYRLIGCVTSLAHAPPKGAQAARTAASYGSALLACAVLVLAVGVWLSGWDGSAPSNAAADRVAASANLARPTVAGRPQPLTSTEGSEWGPALSPDGRYAAFVSSPAGNFKVGDIHIVEVGSAMPVPLTSSPERGNRAPVWSPDGTRIAFSRSTDDGQHEIVIKPVLGGFEKRVATVDVFWGHDWSPTGDQLAISIGSKYEDGPRIHLLSISDGSLVEFTHPATANGDHQPRFSPDGETLAFLRWGIDGSGAHLCLKPVSGGAVDCVTPADRQWPIRDFAWAPNGESLIVSADGLVRVPASGGAVEPLPFGDDAYNIATARSSNRLVYESFTEDSNLWRVPGPAAGSRGTPERLIASTRAELLPSYSPDGSKIAFVSGRTGGWEVWVADAEGARPRRLTEWGFAAFPDWSPDGQLISFSSGRYAVGRGEQAAEELGSAKDEAFSVEAGGGVPRMISDGESGAKAPSWSADGQYVFFTRGANACGAEQLWRRQIASGEETQLTDCAWRPQVGGDGRVYFFNKRAKGISSVSMSGGDERLEMAIEGECDSLPNAWTVWNSNLVYLDCQDQAIKMLDLDSQQTTELAAPLARQQLFEYLSMDVSPDGQWILFSRLDRAASDLILIDRFQ